MTTDPRAPLVCAALAAGGTLLDVATEHDVTTATASRWFAASGLTRTPNKTQKPLSPERRKAIERMIRDELPLATIRRRAQCSNTTIAAVRAEMEGEHV